MTEAIDILNSHNIRPSVQRIAILKYLLEHRIHPTVDDIYLALNPTMPTLSKTTVYNVLRNLVENGAVLALTIDEKNVRYDADISSLPLPIMWRTLRPQTTDYVGRKHSGIRN